jgi:hypothetical protein
MRAFVHVQAKQAIGIDMTVDQQDERADLPISAFASVAGPRAHVELTS